MIPILQVGLLAVAFLLGFGSRYVFKKKPDNLVEQLAESFIKQQTGHEIDFSPDSGESNEFVKPSIIIVSQDEWKEINALIEELEKDPTSKERADRVNDALGKSQRKDLPDMTIIPDHEDFDSVLFEEDDDAGK